MSEHEPWRGDWACADSEHELFELMLRMTLEDYDAAARETDNPNQRRAMVAARSFYERHAREVLAQDAAQIWALHCATVAREEGRLQ